MKGPAPRYQETQSGFPGEGKSLQPEAQGGTTELYIVERKEGGFDSERGENLHETHR